MLKLEDLRREKGLSQYELASKINMTQQRISAYEKGKREPDLETLKEFSRFFNVTTDYLTGNSNYKNLKDFFTQNNQIIRTIKYPTETEDKIDKLVDKMRLSTNPSTILKNEINNINIKDKETLKKYIWTVYEYSLFYKEDNKSILLDNFNKLNDVNKDIIIRTIDALLTQQNLSKR